jgi:NAD+-dependent protein deacetylase sirtuin 5
VPDIRDAVAPGSTFTLITQNVDGLSQRALNELQANSQSASNAVFSIQDDMTMISGVEDPVMLEMHGRVFDVKCSSCGHVELDFSSPICEALAGTEELMEVAAIEPNIPR